VGEQPKKTREDIPAGDDVEAQTPKTPAPSTTPKKKKKLGSEKLITFSTLTRNIAHGVKEGFPIDRRLGWLAQYAEVMPSRRRSSVVLSFSSLREH
jgi:hypothetical protein